jgi:Tannase and feruloyl esterase
VIGAMGGLGSTQSFARLFLAPGNGHCGGDSTGPVASPAGELTALTSWVEHGTAPSTLLASETNSSGAVTETRPLCAYPDGAVYNGSGNISDAASFHCAPVFRT